MTFYNYIESVRSIAIDLTDGRKWRGASDKAAVFDALDAARREYMRLSDENAKLRELAEKLIILAFARCADCDLLDASCALVSTQKCLLWNECESIARELGVEVEP